MCSSESHSPNSHSHGPLWALALGSLGVVFGDIGTSPLYTFQECIGGHHGAAPTAENVWGVLSLIFWSLIIIVSLKYVSLLMKADNQGEGGIMALLALAPEKQRQVVAGRVGPISLMVIAGAALLFGDGVITPAISVLSAVEGLKSVNAEFQSYVVPITVVILVGLFLIQKRGTGVLGNLFGPVMAVWFATIAILGLRSIIEHPAVLWALLPHHAINFLLENGWKGFVLLGSVVLAVTGGEALYADMGHFGRNPIRASWFGLVLPALICCYFGQGALILRSPEDAGGPFFAMVSSSGAKMALVLLATVATIIASQGLISAVFSLTHQAIRLGYMPRMKVLHTSKDMIGQIYVPFVNWILALGCISLVAIFQRASALAAAFGLAVSGTMVLTTAIFYQVLVHRWRWSSFKAGVLIGLLLAFEVPFLLATLTKFTHGGYIPILLGLVLFAIMVIWHRARALLSDYYNEKLPPVEALPERLKTEEVHRIPGLGIYLTANPRVLPKVLDAQLTRLRSLFETVVLATASTSSDAYVEEENRIQLERLNDEGLYRAIISYGFMEIPDIPSDVDRLRRTLGLPEDSVLTYLVGRETFLATDQGNLSGWQENIFAFLYRNCLDATSDFNLPVEKVLEVNCRLDL